MNPKRRKISSIGVRSADLIRAPPVGIARLFNWFNLKGGAL